MSWCTIESDPGVFSELIKLFGVQDVSVEEIYSLDADEQSAADASYGLILLFKYRQEVDPRPTVDPNTLPHVFFSKQVVQNACATQALLSILMNAEGIKLGDFLTNFKEFAMQVDYESKGLVIGESDNIRTAHNSFARPDPFVQEEDTKKNKYATVSYISRS